MSNNKNKSWYNTRKIDKGITKTLVTANCLKWGDLVDLQDKFNTNVNGNIR